MTVNPVAERDGYFLDLTTDVGESLPKVVPNGTILNCIPSIDKGILQLNEFLLEPLNLLRDLELLTELIELGSQRSDNSLCRGHVSKVKPLEVVRESSFTRDELSFELVSDTSGEFIDLGLSLIYSAVDRIHSSGELSTDNRVFQRVLNQTELRRQVLEPLSGALDLSCEVDPHDEVMNLVGNPLDCLTNQIDRWKKKFKDLTTNV